MPSTIDDLESMVRKIQASGVAPISKMRLIGPADAVQTTLAWTGLIWGRDVELLNGLTVGLPLVQPAEGVIYARRTINASDEFHFTEDGFDQLKATLYYELLRRLLTSPSPIP